jgi:hypothetical protein
MVVPVNPFNDHEFKLAGCSQWSMERDKFSFERDEDLEAVDNVFNARPRKTLQWRTLTEALNEHLRLIHQSNVATTD